MSTHHKPIELLPIFRQRIWGRNSLEPLFPQLPHEDLIGEVWFTFEENLTSEGKNLRALLQQRPEILGTAAEADHPGLCPILLKLLFTSDRLSVQVHPDDLYGQKHHQCLGKTEAWYVVDALPPGEVALGFREALTETRFRQAAESGEIENLLDWRKVKAGDCIFVPAGTVHAIGAGLTICEVQENSDITYRLYDYGRPRELHLEHGAKVAQLGAYPHDVKPESGASGREELVACAYFRIERLRPEGGFRLAELPFYAILVCVKGEAVLDGRTIRAGQAWLLPAAGQVDVEGPGSEWIVTYSSDQPATGISLLP